MRRGVAASRLLRVAAIATAALLAVLVLLQLLLPGFAASNPMPLLGAAASPRIWLGTASNVSSHYDTMDNLACVICGQRRFTLYAPQLLGKLYVGPIDNTLAGQPVSLAASAAEGSAEKFPLFEEIRDQALTAELNPGDALYLPKLWWHQVESTAAFNGLVNRALNLVQVMDIHLQGQRASAQRLDLAHQFAARIHVAQAECHVRARVRQRQRNRIAQATRRAPARIASFSSGTIASSGPGLRRNVPTRCSSSRSPFVSDTRARLAATSPASISRYAPPPGGSARSAATRPPAPCCSRAVTRSRAPAPRRDDTAQVGQQLVVGVVDPVISKGSRKRCGWDLRLAAGRDVVHAGPPIVAGDWTERGGIRERNAEHASHAADIGRRNRRKRPCSQCRKSNRTHDIKA